MLIFINKIEYRILVGMIGLFLVYVCNKPMVAQHTKQSVYSKYWEKVALVNDNSPIIPTDTMVVIQTNRKSDFGEIRFLKNDIEENGKSITLLAVCKNGYWKIFQRANLSEAYSYLPKNRDLVIYMEGLGKNFPIAMYRAAGMTTQYKLNVVLLDYPTLNEEKGVLYNYKFAQKNAVISAQSLGSLLIDVQKLQQDKIIDTTYTRSLFFHSMGNVMLQSMVQLNLGKTLQENLVDRVVLNAACVDEKKNCTWIKDINFAKEIVVNYNKKDLHLIGAHLISWKVKLGAKPRRKHGLDQVFYVDFKKILGRSHNGFLNNPGISMIPKSANVFYDNLFHKKNLHLDQLDFLITKKRKNYFQIRY